MTEDTAPKHPGVVLAEAFMSPLGLSANRLGAAIAVPANRVSEIVRGRRSISADTALRLAELFGTEPEYWMRLQSDHDLALARAREGDRITRTITALKAVLEIPELPTPIPGDETGHEGVVARSGEAADDTPEVDEAQFSLFEP